MTSLSRFATAALNDPPSSNQRVKFFKEYARLRASALPSTAESRGTALAETPLVPGGNDELREPELSLPE